MITLCFLAVIFAAILALALIVGIIALPFMFIWWLFFD